jgi:hypothetical protein
VLNMQLEVIHKDKIEYRIHERYHKEISELSRLGFSNLLFTREVSFPMSSLFMFWIYPFLKFNREIVQVEQPFRYVLLNPLLIHHESNSYASVFGLGTKFVTAFTDGSVLISYTNARMSHANSNLKIVSYSPNDHEESISTTWKRHQERILSFEHKGFESDYLLSVDKYEEYMQRADRANWRY